MNETYKTIYERLTNNSRRNNPANMPQVYGDEPEAAQWDGQTARRYGAYAETRTFEGMTHEQALDAMNKRVR